MDFYHRLCAMAHIVRNPWHSHQHLDSRRAEQPPIVHFGMLHAMESTRFCPLRSHKHRHPAVIEQSLDLHHFHMPHFHMPRTRAFYHLHPLRPHWHRDSTKATGQPLHSLGRQSAALSVAFHLLLQRRRLDPIATEAPPSCPFHMRSAEVFRHYLSSLPYSHLDPKAAEQAPHCFPLHFYMHNVRLRGCTHLELLHLHLDQGAVDKSPSSHGHMQFARVFCHLHLHSVHPYWHLGLVAIERTPTHPSHMRHATVSTLNPRLLHNEHLYPIIALQSQNGQRYMHN
mmetsp:Transcript_37004/g.89921  ORF Transcript_37004/g.89921 Transcript_37004/m.89921 type:complete len:284 (+) Transcript_37004:87-938(+)